MRVEHLGAHLDAYINLIPIVNTLRLCHRYGKGPHASIAKLPVELVASIEDYLVAAERKKTRREWAQDFKCFQLLCWPEDHLTTKQHKRYQRLLKFGALDMPDGGKPWPYEEEDGDEVLIHFHLSENQDIWNDVHYSRLNRWEDRTGLKTFHNRGFFTRNRDLILKHFGLDVWLSHVRLPEYQTENEWSIIDIFAAETTIAYLKMPDAQRTSTAWDLAQIEQDDREYYIESGLATELIVPKRLPKPSRARFRRAMRMLGLEPHVHPSQRGVPGVVGEGKGPAGKPKSWPRRMMLIKSTTTSDD